jgi:carboxypeptidase family protein
MRFYIFSFEDRRAWRWKFAALCLLGIFLPAARAQSDAAIFGLVTDSTGGAVAAAEVRIRNAETGAERSLATDEGGRYVAPSLAVGTYELIVEKPGFQAGTRTLTLVVGQREEASFVLQVGDVHQTVEVPANPGVVMVTTEDISGLVGERQVKDLPLNGRSYDQLLTLNPGVVNYTSQRAGGVGTSNSVVGNMFAASGRRPQENLFLLNGVEFTSASEINNTPGGVSGQLLGVDAVREFAVVNLRRGIWQTSGSAGKHRHRVRQQRLSRLPLRVHAKQRPRCAQLLRSRRDPGLSAKQFRCFSRRSASQEQKLRFRKLRGPAAKPGTERPFSCAR